MSARKQIFIGLSVLWLGTVYLAVQLRKAALTLETGSSVEVITDAVARASVAAIVLSSAVFAALILSQAIAARKERELRNRLLDLETEVMRGTTDALRARLLASVNELAKVFEETRDLDSVLSEAVGAMRGILRVESLALELHGSEESQYRCHIIEGRPEDIDLGEEAYERVMGLGQSHLINRLDSFPGYSSLAEKGFKSLLVTPIVRNKPGGVREPIGLLAALSRTQRDFTTHDMWLLTTFATYASLIMENALLYEKTQQLAIHDGLTNLYNHRRFREVLDSLLEEARSASGPLGLLMGDIDYFKNYNDTHGHLKGDVVLRTVGEILRTSVRGSDIVARYGGEEFVVLLPDTDAHGCRLVGENLRAKIAQNKFEGEESQPGGDLTITFGLAVFPADGADAESLISAADRALYSGKGAGRNRLVAVSDLPEDESAREEEIGAREIGGKGTGGADTP